ncbi:MAG: hypothetical protein FJW40_25880, partial [Acidobacteria bacterium]|nr:hypothetical protein [Acidobacteriota bacterium]
AVAAGLKPGAPEPNTAYLYRGRKYPMPIHGFVRDMEWRLDSFRATGEGAQAAVSLVDTPDTRRYYPFGFKINATYSLKDGVLETQYRVRASGLNSNDMIFSIGNHITFRVPFAPDGTADAMVLMSPSSTEILKRPPGLPTGETRARSFVPAVPISSIERLSAVSLTGYTGDPVMELRDPRAFGLRLSHRASTMPAQPVVLFNLWGDPAGGFFSPEPWVGLQNSLNLNQGLIQVKPGDLFEWTIRLEPFGRP